MTDRGSDGGASVSGGDGVAGGVGALVMCVAFSVACAPVIVPCTSDNDCAHARVCVDGDCRPFDAGDVIDCSDGDARALQYEVDYLDLETGDVTPGFVGDPPPDVPWDLTMRFDNNGSFGFPVQNAEEGARIGYTDVDLCDLTRTDVLAIELVAAPLRTRFKHSVVVETSTGLYAVGLPVDLRQSQGLFEMEITYLLAP